MSNLGCWEPYDQTAKILWDIQSHKIDSWLCWYLGNKIWKTASHVLLAVKKEFNSIASGVIFIKPLISYEMYVIAVMTVYFTLT